MDLYARQKFPTFKRNVTTLEKRIETENPTKEYKAQKYNIFEYDMNMFAWYKHVCMIQMIGNSYNYKWLGIVTITNDRE